MQANAEARNLETLDSIIHRAASNLSLGAGVLVAAYALVDSFVVTPKDRVFYLGMRAIIASLFIAHSYLIKQLTPSPRSFLHGYVSYALYIGLFFTAVVRAGIFPSPYYGAAMLMIGSLALMPWRALNAWIICALLIVLWTSLNFWQGVEPVMAVHLRYLVGLSGVTIYASKCRHEAIVQLNKQGHELAGAVQKLSDVARQTAHDIRSPIAALRVVCQAGQEIPELHRLLVRDATDRINPKTAKAASKVA